jgi:hypothetical protein
MAGNVSLFIYSSLFLGITTIYLWKRWFELDVIDLYIIFVGIYFGGYSFVKALVDDYSKVNPLTAFWVFAHVTIVVTLLWVFSRIMPVDFRKFLQIHYLFEQWSRVNKYFIYALLVVIIATQISGYVKYGLISHIDIGELSQKGTKLAYWYTSILMLLKDFIFCAFIAIEAKIIISKNLTRKLWCILLALLVVIASIYGRRVLFNMAVFGIMIYFISQGKNIFQWKYVRSAVLLSLALLIFSNLFQSYRNVIQYPPSIPDKLKNPISAALDVGATLHNIKIRPSPWEFNYEIFKGQFDGTAAQQPRGRILWIGLKNSIAKFIWPVKEVVSLNNLIATMYGWRVIDYAKNNFGFLQADFGFLSILIMPLMMLSVMIIFGVAAWKANDHPILLLLLTGFIINYLINIEQNIGDIFILFRNLIAICLIYIVIFTGYRFTRYGIVKYACRS